MIPDAADIHLTFTRRSFGRGWYMTIQRRTKFRSPGILLGTLLLAINGASVAHAQDAVQNTPPELRDFRLDPPPRETAPEPVGPEAVAPPVTTPTVEETPPPVMRQPSPPVAAPQRTSPAAPVDKAPDTQTERETDAVLAEPTPAPDVAPASTATEPRTDTPAPPEEEGVGIAELAALVAVLLALAGGAFYVWQRQQAAAAAVAPRPRQTAKPSSSPPPRPASSRAQPDVAMPKPTPVRDLSMAFVPENAVVSFSSLNIKGQLQITNAGGTAAENLALSAVLISASKEQQSAIDHFFANSDHIAPTPLGSVKPGGHMNLPLQLGVALHEMQTFSLQNKTLLAPIILAKLIRLSADGTAQEVARLVCMIGRESSPPQQKMGPLRLDQGPRSFDRLGQRALLS